MKIADILNENKTIIPQPDALKVDVTSYEFNSLMKEFRASTDLKAKGDSGLVMFYSDQEHDEFVNFLELKGINFENIESETQHFGIENTASPVAKKKPNRFGV
jgi:D-mannonate dehydratase